MTSRQAAMLYAREGIAYLTAESRTEAGFWIAGSPCHQLAVGQHRALAELLLRTLDESIDGVPNPHRLFDPALNLVRAAGVSNFEAFLVGTTAIRAVADGEVVTLTPMNNAGIERGFEFLSGQSTTSDRSAAELSAALEVVLPLAS